MTDSEALEIGKKLYANLMIGANNMITRFDYFNYIGIANKSLEKQEKTKEAFEKWKAETGGYYGADDETTRFINTLNQILRSDEE